MREKQKRLEYLMLHHVPEVRELARSLIETRAALDTSIAQTLMARADLTMWHDQALREYRL